MLTKKRVFISYSSVDRVYADLVLNFLENEVKIPCWISYRDIIAGTNYSESIYNAIKDCGCIVLLFSEHAKESEHVKNELELAMENQKAVIPCRIDSTRLEGEFDFFLKNKHWLEIANKQKDELDLVAHSVIAILGSDYSKSLQRLNDIFLKIANEGVNDHLQDYINEFTYLISNTYEGQQNDELVSLYDQSMLELKRLKSLSNASPDPFLPQNEFQSIIELMNRTWKLIRTIS